MTTKRGDIYYIDRKFAGIGRIHRSLRTLNRYETGLDHFQRIVGPDTRVREALTTDRIQAFETARLDEDAARETVNNGLIAVSILATYASRRERPVPPSRTPRL